MNIIFWEAKHFDEIVDWAKCVFRFETNMYFQWPYLSLPKVATLCEPGEVYLAQHMGEQGRWVSSTDKKSCMTDKLEILEYCKKVRKKRSIRSRNH